MKPTIHRLFASCLACAGMLWLVSCASLKEGDESAAASDKKKDEQVNLPFLLSMDFAEAKAISKQHAEVPPAIKVAADEIEILKRDAKGQPRKVRAKGHVFVQLDHDVHGGRAFCQEAIISDQDLILRGHPVLQRGVSIVEGVSDVTVLYLMAGTWLRALGPHKLTNPDAITPEAPAMVAWQSGPGMVLPPLDTSDVPEEVKEQMRKAAEAEAVLQKARAGAPPAFPNAPPLGPVTEVPEAKPKS